jgi:hypothetical protein
VRLAELFTGEGPVNINAKLSVDMSVLRAALREKASGPRRGRHLAATAGSATLPVSRLAVGVATAWPEVPPVAPHLRELVGDGGHPAPAIVLVHGPREGHHDAGDLHLFDEDHAETMAALAAMSRPVDARNVGCGHR